MKSWPVRAWLYLLLLLLPGPACPSTTPKTAPEWYHRGVFLFYLHHDADAVDALRQAVRLAPQPPMPHLMLSRSLFRLGKTSDARREGEAAESSVALASDPDGYLIKAWAAHVRAAADPLQRVRATAASVDLVDTGIAIYPTNAELYVLAGEMAPDDLQRIPWYLAALALQPDHPLAMRWKPPIPVCPLVPNDAGQTVKPPGQPMKLFPGLGRVHHPVTAANPQVQAYVDQGLCCLYAYVTNAARHSFESAIQLDPQCSMAYWGLSFCGGPQPALKLAQHALTLARAHGTDAERRYCSIRVLQLQPDQQSQALDALCGAIAAYPHDVDLWMWRATFDGFAGETDDRKCLHNIPFALAAQRLQPDHPSANHELTHAYEAIDRPMLGWRYSWGFRRSAPNMPHAQHMQAHLAMRLGRWKDALACTRESVRLAAAGFPELDRDHHLNIFFWALGHEGRFKEALATRASRAQDLSWARLLRLKLDDTALSRWATERRKLFADGWYAGALADLDQGHWQAAHDKVQHFDSMQSTVGGADVSVWKDEVDGRTALETLSLKTAGLDKLRAVARWSDGLQESHRWGQGSYYDELWGEAALQAGHWAEAREAFGEALAHEHGSIVAALGLQVTSERLRQPELASHYAARAQEIWSEADPGALERLLARLRAIAEGKAQIF